MKLIVVTSSYDVENEIGLVESMFRQGLDTLHLRKPTYTTKDYESYLDRLNPKYRKRIIIHSRHHLSKTYKLLGINVGRNHRRTKIKTYWKIMKLKIAYTKKIKVSGEFDSLSEFKKTSYKYDYIIFSPVFSSISKIGKKGRFNLNKLKKFLKEDKKGMEFYAAGGIDKGRIEKCKELGFDGVAIMGGIWENEDPVEEFIKCKEYCNNL